MNKLLLAAALAANAPALPAAAKVPAAAQSNAEVRMDHISIVTLGSARAKGAPIVLLPGLASPRAVWDGVAADLARTHRVYLVQVNGFGGDAPGANLQPGLLNGIVADLSAALARDHAPPVRFVGHSMGGLVGMMFAKAHPTQVDRLMIVDALPDFAVLIARGGPMPSDAQIETIAGMMRTATAARYGKPMTADVVAAGVDSLALTEAARVRMRTWGAAADARVAGQAIYEDMTTDLRPALVGHSMGGLALLMVEADHPGLTGKLLVVDALPFIGPLFGASSVEAARPMADQMRAMLRANAAKTTPDFTAPDCPASLPAPAAPKGTMTNSGQGNCLVRYGAAASDLRVVGQAMYDDMVTDLTPRLGAIKAPVTLLYPQDDRLLTAAMAAKIYGDAYAGLPSAKLVPITGSYHFIMQDQPAAFAAALDAFVK